LFISATSWHKKDKPYNENNWGAGLKYEWNSQFSIVGVRYKNSFHRWTTAIGFPYSPSWAQLEVQRLLFKPSLAPTFFRGYSERGWDLVLLPSIDVLWDKRWGVNIITDGDAFAGFSLVVRF